MDKEVARAEGACAMPVNHGPCDISTMLRDRELTGGNGRRLHSSGRSTNGGNASTSAGLSRWAEADMLRRCSATYCSLQPEPRSTIAAAFSPDGNLLASTQCAPALNVVSPFLKFYLWFVHILELVFQGNNFEFELLIGTLPYTNSFQR